MMRLNNQTIVKPTELEINHEKISKKQRTASGRLVEEIVAIKRIFSLRYRGLKRSDLQIFLELQSSVEPITFEFTDSGETDTAQVYIASIPRVISPYADVVNTNIEVVLEEV